MLARKLHAKIASVEEVQRYLEHPPGLSVFTNGCFDVLHFGHMNHLNLSRQLGGCLGCLIVAVNDDKTIRELKGPSRPIIPESFRLQQVAALEAVTFVLLMTEPTPHHLLNLLKPDYLTKSDQYTREEVVGYEVVEEYGGMVVLTPHIPDLSTTIIAGRIRNE